MESDGYPSWARLSALHMQLAANNRRIEAVVDSQLENFEQLFQASLRGDWQNLSKTVDHFATSQDEPVDAEVLYQARHVSLELDGSVSRAAPPRHLANLLHACRAAVKRLQKKPAE